MEGPTHSLGGKNVCSSFNLRKELSFITGDQAVPVLSPLLYPSGGPAAADSDLDRVPKGRSMSRSRTR